MPNQPQEPANTIEKVHLVNIEDITKEEEKVGQNREVSSFDRLSTWFAFGTLASLTLLVLSFLEKRFLVLSPFGLIVGLVSWLLRKIFRKFENVDVFSKKH